jgi:hypothetical protein
MQFLNDRALAEDLPKAIAIPYSPTLKVLDANGRVVGTLLSKNGGSVQGYTQSGAWFEFDGNGGLPGSCFFTEANCEGACFAAHQAGELLGGKTAYYEVLDALAFQGPAPIRSMIQNARVSECQNLTPEQQAQYSNNQFKRTRINRSIIHPAALPLKWGIR